MIQSYSPFLAFIVVFATALPLVEIIYFTNAYAPTSFDYQIFHFFFILYFPLVSILSSVSFWLIVRLKCKNSRGLTTFAATVAISSLSTVLVVGAIYGAYIIFGLIAMGGG